MAEQDSPDRAARETDDRSAEAPSPDTEEKNPHAVALGRLGGLKGGKIAAANMTPEQRRRRARKAARARWEKAKRKKIGQ